MVTDLHVAVNNITPLSVAMEMQQWIFFVLLSRDKIFLTAVSTIDVLWYSCQMPDIVVCFEENIKFLDRF
jgi:hypothetical protein